MTFFEAFQDELRKIAGDKSKWVWQGRRYANFQDYMKAKHSGKGRPSVPAKYEGPVDDPILDH